MDPLNSGPGAKLKSLAYVCMAFGVGVILFSPIVRRPNGPHLSDIIVGLFMLAGGIAIHQYAKRK